MSYEMFSRLIAPFPFSPGVRGGLANGRTPRRSVPLAACSHDASRARAESPSPLRCRGNRRRAVLSSFLVPSRVEGRPPSALPRRLEKNEHTPHRGRDHPPRLSGEPRETGRDNPPPKRERAAPEGQRSGRKGKRREQRCSSQAPAQEGLLTRRGGPTSGAVAHPPERRRNPPPLRVILTRRFAPLPSI